MVVGHGEEGNKDNEDGHAAEDEKDGRHLRQNILEASAEQSDDVQELKADEAHPSLVLEAGIEESDDGADSSRNRQTGRSTGCHCSEPAHHSCKIGEESLVLGRC